MLLIFHLGMSWQQNLSALCNEFGNTYYLFTEQSTDLNMPYIRLTTQTHP